MTNAFLPRPFEVLSLGTIQPRGWIAAQIQRDLTEGFAGQLDLLTQHVTNDLFANRIHTAREQSPGGIVKRAGTGCGAML